MCEECSSGYHLILGTETNALGVESTKGRCTDKYPCASPATEFYYAVYDSCSSKSEAGGYCEGQNPISCTSGFCSAYTCCDAAAAEPLDGKCCKACESGSESGICTERGDCPPCDASGAIANGVASPCTNSLAAGTSCEPTCNLSLIHI